VKNLSIVLNVILAVAVAVLYVLHFTGTSGGAEVSEAAGSQTPSDLSIAYVNSDSLLSNYDYFKAVEKGVFCELGKGNVDFQSIVNILNEKGYDGWIVVEQDVLPGMGAPKKCAAWNRQFIKSLGL